MRLTYRQRLVGAGLLLFLVYLWGLYFALLVNPPSQSPQMPPPPPRACQGWDCLTPPAYLGVAT